MIILFTTLTTLHEKIREDREREIFMTPRGSGMSYTSICIAERVARELGTKLENFIVLDDMSVENEIKPKRYIYTTIHTTRASILKNLEKKQ